MAQVYTLTALDAEKVLLKEYMAEMYETGLTLIGQNEPQKDPQTRKTTE